MTSLTYPISMESSKTSTDSQMSLYYDAQNASMPSSSHSQISTLSMEGRRAEAAPQLVERPPHVAEETLKSVYPLSPPRIRPATPSLPDFLLGCSSVMPSRSIDVLGSGDDAIPAQVASEFPVFSTETLSAHLSCVFKGTSRPPPGGMLGVAASPARGTCATRRSKLSADTCFAKGKNIHALSLVRARAYSSHV